MNSASPMLRLADIANEPESPTDDGANPALLLAVITDRAPDGIDPSCNRGLRNHAPIPNGCEEIVFANHAVAIPNQENQNVEHLRFDRKSTSPPTAARAVRRRESCRQKGTPRVHSSASKGT